MISTHKNLQVNSEMSPVAFTVRNGGSNYMPHGLESCRGDLEMQMNL